MDIATVILIGFALCLFVGGLWLAVARGVEVIARNVRVGLRDGLQATGTHEALKQAADNYMASLKSDMTAVASHQERQEQVLLGIVGQLITHLKLVPVVRGGEIVGFRPRKKGEVFDTPAAVAKTKKQGK